MGFSYEVTTPPRSDVSTLRVTFAVTANDQDLAKETGQMDAGLLGDLRKKLLATDQMHEHERIKSNVARFGDYLARVTADLDGLPGRERQLLRESVASTPGDSTGADPFQAMRDSKIRLESYRADLQRLIRTGREEMVKLQAEVGKLADASASELVDAAREANRQAVNAAVVIAPDGKAVVARLALIRAGWRHGLLWAGTFPGTIAWRTMMALFPPAAPGRPPEMPEVQIDDHGRRVVDFYRDARPTPPLPVFQHHALLVQAHTSLPTGGCIPVQALFEQKRREKTERAEAEAKATVAEVAAPVEAAAEMVPVAAE